MSKSNFSEEFIGIHLGDELFDCKSLPVSGIEEFGFHPAEKAFAGGVVLRATFSVRLIAKISSWLSRSLMNFWLAEMTRDSIRLS